MKVFKGKVAVITGAGGGIGSAVAEALAARGVHLALADLNAAAAEATAEKVRAVGVEASVHQVDVSNEETMRDFAADVVDAHGRVDVLVNNAGITLQKTFMTHSLDDWRRVVGVNLWGVIYGCHFFFPHLRASGDAHVVNLSSMAAFVGMPSQASYCTTKAGVRALSESLWTEWKPLGIGVTTVHPGAVRTDMMKATLNESDDVKAAQKNLEMAKKMSVEPAFAARKIVGAIEAGKRQIRIGRDAYIFDWMKRYAPWSIHSLFAKVGRDHASRTIGGGA